MLLELLILLASILAFVLYKVKQGHQYWQKLGVKVPKNSFPIGSSPFLNWEILLGQKNLVQVAEDQYNDCYDQRYYGVYLFANYALVLKDPELIKTITIKDFNYFVDRNSKGTQRLFEGKYDIAWKKQMTNVSGEEWKDIRSTFSPIFTSGKMKGMVKFINEVNNRLADEFGVYAKSGDEAELKTLFGKFSMDTIASAAFGMNAGSFTDPNSQFVRHARTIFRNTLADSIKILIGFMPNGVKILDFFGMSIFKPEATHFFYDALVNTLNHRRKSKNRRNDLIDMMLDAMKDTDDATHVDHEEDDDSKLHHKANKKNIDDVSIVATAMVMLIAGYDTTAQTLSYCVYELAKNPEAQAKLQDEIDEAFEDNNGQVPDYNQTLGMEYLDMVFHETLVRLQKEVVHIDLLNVFHSRESTWQLESSLEAVSRTTHSPAPTWCSRMAMTS